MQCKSRDGAVVARWAHNPKVAGSSPAPATRKSRTHRHPAFLFLFYINFFTAMEIIYEDNHIVIVNKEPGEIVQGDKTGDTPLVDYVKEYLKTKYNKPGNVFCGVVHRIDRPVAGLVIFAKTSKALTRLNEMLRKGEIHKTYLALVENQPPEDQGRLTNYLVSDGKINKTFISDSSNPNAKKSELEYKIIKKGDRYSLIKINLLTGRKHQIRAQLSAIGCPIKGDLKYGARRSNSNGGISLQSSTLTFVHPVSKKEMQFEAPPLEDFKPFYN